MGHHKEIDYPAKTEDEKGTASTASTKDAAEDAKQKGGEVGIRNLYRYATCRDLALLALGLLTVLVSGANQPAQLYVFGRILDNFNLVARSEVHEKINLCALYYFILGVQIMATTAIQVSCFTGVAAMQVRRMRERYFAALLRKPMGFFDTRDSGALATSVLEATAVIGAGMGEELATSLQRVSAFIFGVSLAAYTSWRLTLVVLAGVPTLGLLVAVANKLFAHKTRESAKFVEEASSMAMELLSAIRTVAAFGHEGRALREYRTALGRAAQGGIQQGKAKAALEGCMAPIMFVMFGLGLWYGSKLVSDDMEANEACRYVSLDGRPQDPDPSQCQTGGNIMTAFLCILFGFLGLLQALPGLAALAAARASAGTVFEVIDSGPGAIDALSGMGGAPARPEGRIELVDVTFAYPGRQAAPVYRGLCLAIEAGQTVALAGPSGCGKSTLVGLLERFYDVDSGQVLLDGVDIRSLSVGWLRSQIGLVSQEPVLFQGSISSNIALGREGAFSHEIEAAANMANAHGFVSKFPDGYETYVGEKGVQLSGGQNQRIAIARAVVRDPLILILDEATSALDAESQHLVQAALDDLLRAKRRTTIIIAHRLSTIRDADKIVVISGGVVVEEGAHEALMQRPQGVYCALVEAQAVGAAATAETKCDAGLAPYDVQVSVAVGEGVKDRMKVDSTTLAATQDPLVHQGVSRTEVKPEKSTPSPMKWLIHLSWPEKWHYATGMLGACITGLALPAIGFLMAEFIVVFFNTDVAAMRSEAVKWAVVFMCMGAVNSLGAVLRQCSFSVITERLVMRVREAAFQAMLRQDIGWFDASGEHTAGALVNQLANDCFLIKALTGERASIATSQLFVFGAGLYIAFEASWQLTLIVFAIIPLIVVPVVVQAKVVGKYSASATESSVDSGRLISESLLHLRTIAAFGLEGRRAAQLDAGLSFPMRQEIRKGVAMGIGTGVAAGVILFGAAFKYVIGGIFFDKGLLEFADIMRVVLVLIFMAFGMNAVSRDASDKAEAMVAARRVHRLINAKSAIDALAGDGATPGERAAGRVELVDVTFAYPSRREVPVYRGLCLTIEAGQIVALAGPSGCGKSTLVGLLERFYDVDAGQVLLDGVDIRSLSVGWLRSQIGLVSQEPVLFTGSIGWNIALGREGAGKEDVESAAHMANAHNFVTAFPRGYETPVGERAVLLSGGQKQRLAIARAVIRDPAVLVLDEATSALDTESERVVQAALNELTLARRRTTIIIAHRLSTIRGADKIVVLSDGVVVEEGSHDVLVQREEGVYRALAVHDSAGREGCP